MSGVQNKKQFKDETLREVEISLDDVEDEENIFEKNGPNFVKNIKSI